MGVAGKIMLALLAFDLAFFVGGVNTNPDLLVFSNFLDVNVTTGAYNTTGIGGNITGQLIPAGDPISSTINNLVVLPIFLISSFFTLIASLLFAPAVFLNSIGAPGTIVLFVGASMLALYVIGIIGLIRGTDV